MRPVIKLRLGLLFVTTAVAAESAKPGPTPTIAASPAAASFEVTSLALPDAPAEGVTLDYLAVDRGRHRVWVPAGGTGNAVVIETRTQKLDRIEKFPTAEVERRGKKRLVGPSSATIGDGFVYLGNRADSSVCAVNATTLARGGCVTIPSSPDGLAYVAGRKEVWVTAPRDQSIFMLDVSTPATPKLAGNITLEGDPEGYAVDDKHGLFYTNLEDKDRTLRIDMATRKITATWMPSCGEDGPRGLAVEPNGRWLMVACTDRVEVLAADTDGRIVSKLDTGGGVDNVDYVSGRHLLYVAAGGAATLTVAHLDDAGVLQQKATVATAKGARNAVATEEGTVYVANGPAGTILVVRPTRGN